MNDFVRNLWYMAGWEEEVPDDGVLARKLLDQKWLVMRQSDGSYAMLRDRCPHRFVQLSLGTKKGDQLHCAYHGLGFDGSGACVHNPSGGDLPPGASVPTMPVVARDSILWFWPGDPERADPATIPDFGFLDTPIHNRGVYLFPVDYRLIVDNLMDLSHAEFIHTETFGTNGSLFEVGSQDLVQNDDGSIANNWTMTGARPPHFALSMLPDGALVDQQIHITWHAPASMALLVTMSHHATGESVVPDMINPHILTPETATSTHYFFTDGPQPDARKLTEAVFLGEDEPMVRSAQEGMGGKDFWDNHPVILPTDAAAIRVRRRMMQLARAEAKERPDA